MDASRELLETREGRFFWRATAHPALTLAVSLLAVLAGASAIPWLQRDTRFDAFIPPGHPSVATRESVNKTFALSEPLAVAIVSDQPNGVFTPDLLGLVARLTDEIERIPGVGPGEVTSLASATAVVGTGETLSVTRLLDPVPATQPDAERVRHTVMESTLYPGRLVARDGRATSLIVPLSDPNAGEEVYRQIVELVSRTPIQGGTIHVAGEAASSTYLGRYIDADARLLYPLAFVTIATVLVLSYRTWGGVILPNLVVAGAVSVTLGGMVAAGMSFYTITNALPVVLIAISVSDTVHVLGHYYDERAHRPLAPSREVAVRTMIATWRSVLLTSVTDAVGFLALGLTSSMPPVRAFGLLASAGAGIALVFSLFTVPACLIVLPPGALGAFATRRKPAGLTFSGDVFGRAVGVVGRVVAHRPIVVLAVGTVVALVGAAGATLVRVDEDRIENFGREEAIYRADRVINRLLAGTNVLDIVVSTPEEEDLFQPAHLRRIEALQQFLDGTPHVTETTSIVDFLEQMNRAVHEGRPEAFRLPETAEVAAQYLLLYGASGRSADLESYIDDGYRLANVRAHLDTGRYSEVKDVLGRVERYLQDTFEGPGISATMSGRPVVEHHWMETLAPSTVSGVALAFVGVWLAASIGFGSLVAGLVSLVPVTIAVLVVFAVMGFSGLWLGIGTSMFADIAVGTAVNPALRIIDRVIVLVRNEGSSLEEAFATALPSTGRGLLFDCSATAFGFGVLMTSQVPPLVWFGVLVSVCVLAGLVVTLTILPALLIVLQPSFLVAARAAGPPTSLATK